MLPNWSSSPSSLVLENTPTNSRTSRRKKDEDEQGHYPGVAGPRGSEVRLVKHAIESAAAGCYLFSENLHWI